MIEQPETQKALQRAMATLSGRLVWDEHQHDTGAWHVSVSVDGCAWAGNDGHLLSTDLNESRLSAFEMFVIILASEPAESLWGDAEEPEDIAAVVAGLAEHYRNA